MSFPSALLGSLLREPLRNGKSARASANGEGVRVFTLTAVTKADFGEENTKISVLRPEDAEGVWAEPGDIFIERSNTPELVGTAAMYTGKRRFAVFPDLLIRVRPDDRLDERFLAYFLRSETARRHFRSKARGIAGTMPKISQPTIEALRVPVPSRPVQHSIVAAIETHFSRLDAAVASLTRAKANVKRARASVLKAAVEGRLVPTEAALARAAGRPYEPASALLDRILAERKAAWAASGARGKYKEPTRPEAAGQAQLQEGWELSSVEAVCVNVVDCPHSTPKRVLSGRLCARTSQFRPGILDLSEPEYVTEATYNERISRLKPQPGDILYSREGGILGIACQVPSGVELCLGQRMMLMRAALAIEPRYLMYVLNSPVTVTTVLRLTGGSAAPHINVRDIKAFAVPLPPLAEQRRIVAEVDRRLSVLDALDITLDANLARCARLRQSILKRAFEGRLVQVLATPSVVTTRESASPAAFGSELHANRPEAS
jgi:type I restriction enzyme, S subunit